MFLDLHAGNLFSDALPTGNLFSDALPTGNFPEMGDGQNIFDMIRKLSPDFPLMVTEFWPGWFDHWGSKHKGLSMESKYPRRGYKGANPVRRP